MDNCFFTSNSDEWCTPVDLFNKLNSEFHFTVDLCANNFNHLCDKFYSISNDGLKADLTNQVVFCNPPYSRPLQDKFIKKCFFSGADTCVLLIPARTDKKVFHDYILPFAEIRFIKGRLHFSGSKNSAPFPSMIVIFNKFILEKNRNLDYTG